MAFAFSRVRWPWALGLSATLTTLLWCLLSLNPLGHTIYRPLPLISVPPGKTWRLSLVPYEPRRSAEGMPSVAILTPTKNARRHIDRLLALFKNLSYPRDRVSLAFLDSDSNDLPTPAEKADVVALAASGALPDFDLLGESSLVGHDSLGHGWRATGSLYSLLRSVPDIQKAGFASLRIIQRDFGLPLPQGDRHAPEFQRARREVLARSRNTLLAAGLEKEDWALWIDSDVASLPTDLIQQLLSAGKDIVVPNVVMKPGGRSYDLNSWRAGKLPAERDGKVGRALGGSGNPTAKKLRQRPEAAAVDSGGVHDIHAGSIPEEEAVEALLGDDATLASVRAYHDSVHAAEVAAGRPHALHMEGYGNEAGHLYLHHLRSLCDKTGSSDQTDAHPGLVAAGDVLRETRATADHAQAAKTAPTRASRSSSTSSSCVVRLDAVGGAVLLVRGDLHRQGLIFPPFPFRHRIETEGLSMMALDMGTLSWGMPLLEVIHH